MTNTEVDNKQVYYDPKVQILFTIKRQLKKYVIVGGCGSPYYDDAITSYMRYRVTNTYLKSCQPIDTTSHLLFNDGTGFRLRDEHQWNKVDGSPDYHYLSKESRRLVAAQRYY